MSAAPDGSTSRAGGVGRARGGRRERWRRSLSIFFALISGESGAASPDGGLRGRLVGFAALAALVGATAVVALLAIPEVPRYLCPLGALVGLLYYYPASRRDRRRRRLLQLPFPDADREVLRRRVPFYWTLPEDERRRFEGEVQVFLAEQRIYELEGGVALPMEKEREHRVLIAASAATLVLGRPEWRLPTVRDVVLYPGAFTEETYEQGPMAHTVGMVHSQGPILFSVPALLRAYPSRAGDDAGADVEPITENVGLHEFAHVLDFAFSENRAGGVPGNMSPDGQRRWARQMEIERERLSRGDSVLHPYGLKSDAELFAVAVEAFFTDPLRVRAAHPELYRLFSDFFNQDPASRLLPQQVNAFQTAWLWPWQSKTARFVA